MSAGNGAGHADLQLERAVLDCVLSAPATLPDVRQRLPASAFYWAQHRLVYEAACAVADAGGLVDLLTVEAVLSEAAPRHGEPWAATLAGVLGVAPLYANAAVYAARLAELGQARQVGYLARLLADDPTSTDARAALQAALAPVNGNGQARAEAWRTWRLHGTPEVAWVVNGLVPAGGLALVGSTPKAGKTWLVLAMALCCAAGRPFLGRFGVPAAVGVHYLALEGSDAALRHRVGALAHGLGLDPDLDALLGDHLHVAYKPPVNLSDPASAAAYVADVQATGARLAVVDTVRRAARIRERGEGVEDLQRLQANLHPLTSAGITVLLLHHARKVQAETPWTPPLERLSGSGDWGGICEVGLVLDRGPSTDWRNVRMEVDGRDVPAYPTLQVYYDGEGSGPQGLLRYSDTLAIRCEEAQEPEDAASFDAAKVSAWLATRPRVEATTAELAAFAGCAKRTVPNHHHALSKWGVAWDDPGPGRSRTYWLSSPGYAHQREPVESHA